MLRTTPRIETFRTRMRLRVCPHCRVAAGGGGACGPGVARACESRCPLFVRLPMLRKVAVLADPMLRPRREAVRGWMARVCAEDAAAAGSPLARNRRRILEVVS